MKSGLIISGILVVIIVVVGYVFTSKATVQPTSTQTPSQNSIDNSNLELVTVAAKEFSFDKSEITVSSGKKVRLTLKNAGRMQHDLVIEGQNIATDIIGGGQETSIEFELPAGEYTYSCSVGNHKAQGMVGKLIVK